MKRIYGFITTANQVLLFFLILGGIAGIGHLAYSSISSHYEPPHVPVAQTPDEATKSVVKDVRFLGQSAGVYVFGIVKRVIAFREDPNRRTLKMDLRGYSSESEDAGQIVNVAFSKDGQRVRTLLAQDGMVLSHSLSGQYRMEKFKPHLFRCVTEDTDGNHVLDGKDRNDLYIVSDGLEKPDLVIKEVLDFEVITPTHLVVKTGTPDTAQFWDVDTELLTRTEVIWK